MNLSDFDFSLPQELIAQFPLPQRSASRLLHLNATTGAITHTNFSKLLDFLRPNDLLVFNNTKVIPARLLAQKDTGGKIEILVERIIDPQNILAQIRASKPPKNGSQLIITTEQTTLTNLTFTVIAKTDCFYQLALNNTISIFEVLEQYGQLPLPPYITHKPSKLDQERYQTVYAAIQGAVAAPTAGLHFDFELFTALQQHKIATTFITLHVGAGTFQPVREEDITQHKMHYEYFSISATTANLINTTKQRGGRIIAVGTTTVRALESASQHGLVQPIATDTNIFIYPGYQFHIIDALITNFHLPKSSLLMLVSAFAGHANIMRAYNEAIQLKYRFFSYGDAMLITKT